MVHIKDSVTNNFFTSDFSIYSKKTPSYNVDLQSLLRIPANVFWKDSSGVHRGCNDSMAETLALASRKEFEGLTMYDISREEVANSIQATDMGVMQSKKSTCIIELSGTLHVPNAMFLSIKSPLLNNEGRVEGLWGLSLQLDNLHLMKNAMTLPKMIDGIKLITATLDTYCDSQCEVEKMSLTARESEVLFHLMQGKCAKEIARLFSISTRTVELHIEHIKTKAHCRTKSQLFTKALRFYRDSLARGDSNLFQTKENLCD